ncbi:GNAT family N-acetyltransferase [Streptomyces sp. VNUA116]|uniref:GNAT family N-acetyltransferase n=1 Tax=Streptomyces sp. VNUA116 TaxID=3062449 RepID=UPI0034A0614D
MTPSGPVKPTRPGSPVRKAQTADAYSACGTIPGETEEESVQLCNVLPGDVEAYVWMVLPEFQGQGLGKRAVCTLLRQARDQGRWGVVHAFPAVNNAASNGICRSVGFRFLSETDVRFADRVLKVNHWDIDPRTDLT